MRTPMRLSCALVFLATACHEAEPVVAAERPRPVTVLTLSEGVPRGELIATGVVEPYRETQVGFEVAGRVTFVLDVGQEVRGPLLDGEGQLLLDATGEPRRLGDVIAVLDDTRYRQAVAAVELKIESTKGNLAAQQIDLESVASADLASAKAQAEAARIDVASAREGVAAGEAALSLATSTVERDRELVASGAVSQSVLDKSEADLLTTQAQLEQARASVDGALQAELAAAAMVAKAEGAVLLKTAQIDTTRAQLAELGNELDRAVTDLEACSLRAPFTGRITNTDVATGSFVGAGQGIATLVLMAPVKVVFTASAAQDRQLLPGMGVRVYPEHGPSALVADGVVGTIFEKGDVADPNTRTFRVGIMTRNPILTGGGDPVSNGEGAAPVTDIFPVITPLLHLDGPLFVNTDCVLEEGGETYVLQLPDLQLMRVERDIAGTYVPRRVRVVLADDWEQIDQWTIRRLEDAGGLELGDALVVDPTPDREESLTLGSRQWAFRPGDVVRVGLDVDRPPPGLWVPVSAIRARGEERTVLLVEEDRVRALPVTVHEASGELRRVEGEGLEPGRRLVISGVHYVADGDRVEVVGTRGD